jgi:hypothetical protein
MKKWGEHETDGFDDKQSVMSSVALKPGSIHSKEKRMSYVEPRKLSVESPQPRRVSDFSSGPPASPIVGRPGSMAMPPPYNNQISAQIPLNNSGNRNSRGSNNRMSMMSMGSYSSAPFVTPGNGNSGGIPPDEEILFHVRRILATANLMTVTKKNVREELGELFGCELTSKRGFINECIDDVLARG